MRILIFVLCLIPFSSFGWGPTGHRVVGEVAQQFLTLETRTKIFKILKGQSLARVANWPDEIKSEPQTYSQTFNWHYTTWSDDVTVHDGDHENESTGFLLKEINENLAVLKDSAASDDKKAFALKFIVHLVGDLHQPFHVGGGNDLGGNACRVMWHGKGTNLHAVWDESMISQTALSFTEMTKFISQGRTGEEIESWKKGDVVTWAQESKDIRTGAYPDDVVASIPPLATKKYCLKGVADSDVPKLAYDYSYKYMPVVEKRLYQAGLRLALLLNQNL